MEQFPQWNAQTQIDNPGPRGFNRHPVSLPASPSLSFLYFLSPLPLPAFLSLPSPILLTNKDLLNEALTKSELMNYSNTYDVIIVINGPPTCTFSPGFLNEHLAQD